MADIEHFSLRALDAAEREEIEGATRTRSSAWLADNQDIVAVWVVLLLIGAGLVAGFALPYVGLVLPVFGLALIGWTVVTWVRTHGKRGVVFTRNATWRVRGEQLVGVRHARVAEVKLRQLGRPGRLITVVELHTEDRKKLMLFVKRAWAEAAVAMLAQGAGKYVRVSRSAFAESPETAPRR